MCILTLRLLLSNCFAYDLCCFALVLWGDGLCDRSEGRGGWGVMAGRDLK